MGTICSGPSGYADDIHFHRAEIWTDSRDWRRGLPSKEHDIRLGGVVVSTPTGKSPGVVQYDMGKTVQEGRFDQTGTGTGGQVHDEKHRTPLGTPHVQRVREPSVDLLKPS
jgi:hypothetical protein